MSEFIDRIKGLFEQAEHGAVAQAVDERFVELENRLANAEGQLAAIVRNTAPQVEAPLEAAAKEAEADLAQDVAPAAPAAAEAPATPAASA